MKFDHIGIVVANLARGREHLSAIFEISRWTLAVSDPINGVHVQFGVDASGICYELIAPFGDDSPIGQALKTRRGIINHVAYLVDDLAGEARRLEDNGCVAAGPARPAIAYHNRRIQFFVSPLRFIVEIIEAPDHRHRFLEAGEQL